MTHRVLVTWKTTGEKEEVYSSEDYASASRAAGNYRKNPNVTEVEIVSGGGMTRADVFRAEGLTVIDPTKETPEDAA